MKKTSLIIIIALIIIALIALFAAKTAGQKKIDNGIPANMAISDELGG